MVALLGQCGGVKRELLQQPVELVALVTLFQLELLFVPLGTI